MPAVHLFLGLSLVTTVGCGRVGFDDADGDAAAATNAISLGPLSVTNVTLTTFEVEIPFTGDANRDASVTLSRCNDTDAIGCHPSTGQREVMTRGAASFTATITVSAGDDPNDTLTLEASPMDPDGAPASVTGSVTLTAASACVHGTRMFTFTGAATSFVVPSGCTIAVVKAWGAGGGGAGGDTNDPGSTGGGGGFARSTLDIAPGETLTIEVGGGGGGGGVSPALIASGGGGGGDLSGVRRGANFLVIAGGGGGAAGNIGGGALRRASEVAPRVRRAAMTATRACPRAAAPAPRPSSAWAATLAPAAAQAPPVSAIAVVPVEWATAAVEAHQEPSAMAAQVAGRAPPGTVRAVVVAVVVASSAAVVVARARGPTAAVAPLAVAGAPSPSVPRAC